jgi:alcohol dehydrogenase class IV
MNFKFQIGTKVIFGQNCVGQNSLMFGTYGHRAIIVTGETSGKASGALEDVISALNQSSVEYMVYDRVRNNPSLENVKEGGIAAADFNADFVIGIGGGSPLDAAKAIAVLAVNNIEPVELYKNVFQNKPLPVIAIPTTAGTGSEVTPYSILSRKDMQTKMSFGNDHTFPKLAFLDATYTKSLPYNITVDTAVDALSHAVEGFIGKRSTPLSDIMADKAIEIFGECLDNLINDNIDLNIREKLLYVSMLAGMVISHTGTTIVHGMGYSLTYFMGIPHGRANGLLMEEYFKYNYEYAKVKIDNIFRHLRVKDAEEFGAIIKKLMEDDIKISEADIRKFASLAMKQRSISSNIRDVTENDLAGIMIKVFHREVLD